MGFADDSSPLDRIPPERGGSTRGAHRPSGEGDGIAWGVPDATPGEQTGCVPIFRAPTTSTRLQGVWISDRLQAVMTHWDGRRTVGCRGGVDRCRLCDETAPCRLMAYGAGLVRGTTWGLVELTTQATRENIAWTQPGANLRGRSFALWRVRQGMYERVQASTSDAAVRLKPGIVLPSPPDVRSLLLKIWAG